MKKEFLTSLNIDDATADKVVAEHKKALEGFVPKSRLDEMITERDTLKGTVSERDKQLKELQKSNTDNKELEAQIKKLQEDNKAEAERMAAELLTVQKNAIVESALLKAGARDPKVVKVYLAEFLETATVKEGEIVGLGDQITALTKDEEKNFCFKFDNPTPAVPKGMKPGEEKDPAQRTEPPKPEGLEESIKAKLFPGNSSD
ncbi:MAG: phage scaffolding protein [Bacillota bacterium]|jgi:hypothetical protein